jgi:hypothetical protein
MKTSAGIFNEDIGSDVDYGIWWWGSFKAQAVF